jgi:hypothetical protein
MLHRLAVDEHVPVSRLWVVRALHQLNRRRLATSALADERDGLAGGYVQ